MRVFAYPPPFRDLTAAWLAVVLISCFGCAGKDGASSKTDKSAKVVQADPKDVGVNGNKAGTGARSSPQQPLDPAGKAKKNNKEPKANAKAKSQESKQSEPGADAKPETGGSQATKPDSAMAETQKTTPPLFGTVRLVLMTDLAPLVLELRISVNGRSHDAAFDELIREVLRLADADRNGKPEWKELVNSATFRYGQFGNMRLENEQQRMTAIRNFDYDKDGVLDSDEIPAFLSNGRNSQRSFFLQPENMSMQRDDGTASVIFDVLDADDDGTISRRELQEARDRLRGFDANDDHLLVAADFLSQDPRLRQMAPAVGQRYGPSTAVLLSKDMEWGTLLVNLERHYAFGGSLDKQSFRFAAATYPLLDKDKDGQIGTEEIKSLLTIDPHLTVAIRLGKRSSTGIDKAQQPSPAIEFVGWNDELKNNKQVSCQAQNGKLTFTIGGQFLTLIVNDATGDLGGDRRGEQFFANIDKDKNGYVDQKEVGANVAGLNLPLMAIDFDGDGKVYLPELKRYFRQQAMGRNSQLSAQPNADDNPIFTLLDANGDQRITERELAEMAARLSKFDTNGDAQLTLDEIPKCRLLTFSRGAMPSLRLPAMPSGPPPTAAKGPGWFVGSDRNNDGEVSRREFLGSDPQFEALDSNQDGFVSIQEAKTFATSK